MYGHSECVLERCLISAFPWATVYDSFVFCHSRIQTIRPQTRRGRGVTRGESCRFKYIILNNIQHAQEGNHASDQAPSDFCGA